MTQSENNTTAIEERPLVTFALFAYNQEKYIREAVEGAFSQTYSPLEIILSDDCSTDRTLDIMQEMASKYKGPHKIYINSNESKLGLSSHINREIKIANGSLIVAAAGDDISFSTRVSKLTSLWTKRGKPSGILYSKYQTIDSESNLLDDKSICEDTSSLTIQDFVSRFNPGIVGGSQAWTKDLIVKFGPLPHGLFCEDAVFAFRAKLYGQVLFCDQELLKYRRHCNSLSYGGVTFQEGVRLRKKFIDVYNVFICDISNSAINDQVSQSIKESLMLIIQDNINQIHFNIKISEGAPLKDRLSSAFEITKNKGLKKQMVKLIAALMPSLYCIYKNIRH
jgi:glycosyltransferase involved in cell wall biosynthesis